MELYHENHAYCSEVYKYIDFNEIDVFYNVELLNVIYGENWESCFIVDTITNNFFLNVYKKNRIGNTDLFDIEPKLGYSGFYTNTDDHLFIQQAINKYNDFCKGENIIAELIRFNHLQNNSDNFVGLEKIMIIDAKEIITVDCFINENDQILQFKSKSARYMIRKALKTCEFKELPKEKYFLTFKEYYLSAMKRLNANSDWFFDEKLFERILKSSIFKLYGVIENGKIGTISLMISHKYANYYFLSANSSDIIAGANELLIMGLCQETAKQGTRKLILGGGNTNESDDPLLRFKKKFTNESHMLKLGMLVHNEEEFKNLCNGAVLKNPELSEIKHFLKYRLLEAEEYK